jgi:hypothetical protein
MKRGRQIASYILCLIICIGSTTNLVLLISSQNYPLIVVILSVAIAFVAILFSFAMFINGFRRKIKLIVEHERGRQIASYILCLIICIECITYLVLLMFSSQNYRLIIGILFNLAMIIYGFRQMIKLIAEPAGERHNEQEQTIWTQK